MKKQTKLLLIISSVLALGLIHWNLLRNYEVDSQEISEYDLIIQPQFEKIGSFSEDLVNVKLHNKWGYMDKKGKVVIKPQFNRVYPFKEGLACVKLDDKWGYIDKTGRMVIDPQFNTADWFMDEISGLAVVQIDGKRGYIDKTGKIVI